jgi:hypothetical protein
MQVDLNAFKNKIVSGLKLNFIRRSSKFGILIINS